MFAVSLAPSVAEAGRQPARRAVVRGGHTGAGAGQSDVTVSLAPRNRPRLDADALVPVRADYRAADYTSKDEMVDVAGGQQAAYKAWRGQAMRGLRVASGRSVDVAVVDVGPPAADKPTIVHFHGATVQVENVLLFRLAEAYAANGTPVRVIGVPYTRSAAEAEAVIAALTADGGKVALQGHSAGAAQIATMAAKFGPDKISHLIALGQPMRSVRGIPTLNITGTRDNIASATADAERYQQSDPAVTSVNLDGADHSMRQGEKTRDSADKARSNATAASAQLARRVAETAVDFVNDAPSSFIASVRGTTWNGRFADEP